MGALNRACFEASTGRYVMLSNDDVIVRTPGWDTTIYRTFARFGDDIALVHVNDLLFQERLCTFPVLSRRACLEIGICPACYRRYRIDDHICDTYRLLACLGHERRCLLEGRDIRTQELYDRQGCPREMPCRCFRSAEGKVYALEPETFAADSRDFAARLDDRKRDACKLARLIETAAMESRQAAYEGLLAKVRDPFGCRPNSRPYRSRAVVARPASRARARDAPANGLCWGKSGGKWSDRQQLGNQRMATSYTKPTRDRPSPGVARAPGLGVPGAISHVGLAEPARRAARPIRDHVGRVVQPRGPAERWSRPTS